MKPVLPLASCAFSLSLALTSCGGTPEEVTWREEATNIADTDRPKAIPPLSSIVTTLHDPMHGLGDGGTWHHGAGIGPNVRVNGDDTALPQNEPAIAWDPADPDNLIVGANDYRSAPGDYPPGVYSSEDGGRTWRDGVLPGLTIHHGGPYKAAGDPALACTRAGDCYYATIAFDFTTVRSAVAVNHSHDGGKSWQAPAFVVQDNDPTIFHDKDWIGVDNSHGPHSGSVYVTWTHFLYDNAGNYRSSHIVISHSRDHGRTWSALRQVTPAAYPQNQGSRPIVDRHGRLYVVYENFIPTDPLRNQQLIQRSDDGGVTFSAPVHVSYVYDTPSPIPPAKYRTNSFPAIAADPLTGALHVVWSDSRNGSVDILLSSSLDHGMNWTEPVRANDTPRGAKVQHAFPAVACGPLGLCAASFYDTRNDPVNAVLVDVYLARVFAVPGHEHHPARSFAGRNLRVTDYTSDPGTQFQGTFFGDYTDLAIGWAAAHPVWTDTRVEKTDSMGHKVHQQDIFTARVPLWAD